MYSINKLFFVFSIALFSITIASEYESKEFCVRNLFNFVQQRTRPEGPVAISELERNIELTINHCSKTVPELINETYRYAVAQNDPLAAEYLCKRKLEPALRTKIRRQKTVENTVLVLATAVVGFVAGHVFSPANKKK